MINGSTVNHWACINFSRSVQESTARTFCQELAQMCQVSGMVILLVHVISVLMNLIRLQPEKHLCWALPLFSP